MRITFITFLMLVTNCIFAQFSGKGTGTSDDPYQITTADELFEVRNALNASYKLMNDIDLTDWIAENNPTQGWSPIGDENGPFTGNFNGNQKMIKGLCIKRPSTDNIGLFGYIAYPCIIENLYLKSPNIIGNNNCGALVGFCHGGTGYNYKSFIEIRSVHIIMPQVQGISQIGGLMGYARRVMTRKNSITSPLIKGNENIGGIAGACYDYNGNNYNIEADSICNNIVAGGRIEGVKNVGGITGYSGYIYSGYASNNFMDIYIYKNICSSSVKGEECVGGVCGKINSVYSIKYSYNTSNTSNSRSEDSEGCCHHINDNCFKGEIEGQYHVAGIIGGLFCELNLESNRAIYVDTYAKTFIDIYRNICSGNIFSQENASGILGEIPTTVYINGVASSRTIIAPQKDVLSYNVFCGDTISSQYTNSDLFRISNHEGSSNYALSTSTLLIDGQSYVIEEDNAQQGVGYGRKTLMKQSTYEGLGFDFKNDWAIVEGETYPYNINQCRPATVTSFKSGTSGTIEGTAIGKSSQCNGNVYVSIGDYFYEGTVTNGQWTVLLGEVKVGAVAKVTVMVDGMMPSILTTAIAEKGSSTTPVVDNTPDTDISALSDVVYINNVEASVGTQLTLSVKMKNAVTAEGFGFDLYLPDGVTVARDEEGFPMVELSTERTTSRKTNSFDAAFQSDGSLRVLAASTNGSAINGNDGEVCLITINIDNDMIEGDYPILLKNIAISDVDAVSHRTEQVKSTLTISAYTPGDANNDGVIDVSDFTATAHYLLGNAPTGFNVKAGDANGDSVVDVADLTAVAHIILYGSVNRPSSARAFEMNEPQ